MLDRGVYPPPSQFEAWFVSLAHDEGAVDRTLEAAAESLAEALRMSDPAAALRDLAAQLRDEDTPIAPHVVEPAGSAGARPPGRGRSRQRRGPGRVRLVVEAVHEGYLLHYGEPRLLAGHDPDLALLAGDYLYALGLDRLAALGDGRAVAILADLISRCAQLHAEGETAAIPDLWDRAARQIAASPSRLS